MSKFLLSFLSKDFKNQSILMCLFLFIHTPLAELYFSRQQKHHFQLWKSEIAK